MPLGKGVIRGQPCQRRVAPWEGEPPLEDRWRRGRVGVEEMRPGGHRSNLVSVRTVIDQGGSGEANGGRANGRERESVCV